MNDDQDITRALDRLNDVPDRSDWKDVTRRAASARPSRQPTRRMRRPFVAIGSIVGVTALATILGVLLIRAPENAERSPSDRSRFLPAVPDGDVPPTVRDALGGSLPNSTVMVFSQYVNGKSVRAWRAIDARGQYLTAIERVGSPAERVAGGSDPSEPVAGGAFTPNCVFASSALPADPPGSPRRVVVPEIFGMTVGDGIARLRAAGFTDIRPPESGRELLATDPLPGRSAFVSAPIRLFALDGVAGVTPYRDRTGDVTDPTRCGSSWTRESGGPSRQLIYGEVSRSTAHVDLDRVERPPVREDAENGFFAIEVDQCLDEPLAITARDSAGAQLGRLARLQDPTLDQTVGRPAECGFGPPVTIELASPLQEISLLDDATRTTELTPDAVPSTEPTDVSRARLATTTTSIDRYGPLELVVVPTRDDGELCLVVRGNDGSGGSQCWERETVQAGRAALWHQHGRQGDPIVLAGIAPDGVRTVTVHGVDDKLTRGGSIGPDIEVTNNVWYAVASSAFSSFQITIADPSTGEIGALFTLSPTGVD